MEYGRYRILSQLGQGGMATVYLAEDPLLNRLVAIKVIQAHLSSNSGLMDRFNVEAKTIASLRHINIVEVFDFGIQDDQQFLVMEYIDGQNLQAVCSALRGAPMPNTVAASIICQAAEGLTSAEKHGVVHRDIKPENLLFNSEGLLKIADFGIAHISDEGSRTQTGAVLGSPNFMSPEQIEGQRPTDKTDIFSLGGVFYYCLTAKMPFTGTSIPVTMRNICERPHPPILEINPQADPNLARLIDVLLQKHPDNRGDGARWLANNLRAYLKHFGVVDIVDHVKSYIHSLGLSGGGQTIAEGGRGLPKSGMHPARGSGGSSIGGIPPSAIIKTGSSPGGSGSFSGSLNPSGYRTQATTGAMGPSSRSPVVWIGVLLSLCVLILAGAIVWTRLDRPAQQAKVPPTMAAGERPTKPPSPNGGGSVNQEAILNAAMQSQPGTGDRGGNPGGLTPPGGAAKPAEVIQIAATKPNTGVKKPTINKPPIGETRPVTVKPPVKRPVPAETIKNDPPKAEQTGFVLIKSAPPFAALTLNGKPQGETPMNAYLEVPVGKCRIEIVHRLSPPFDTVIHITPGFKREFKFRLDR